MSKVFIPVTKNYLYNLVDGYARDKNNGEKKQKLLNYLTNSNIIPEDQLNFRHDSTYQTPLNLAYDNHLLEIVSALLMQHNIIDAANSNDETLFYRACRDGKTDIVELLLNKHPGVDVAITPEHGMHPLFMAYDNKHFDIVELILQKKNLNLDINVTDFINRTLFYRACQDGKIAIVKQLLTHPKLDITIKPEDGEHSLFTTYNNEHFDIVKLILPKKNLNLDINATDSFKTTLFYTACQDGRTDIVEQLLTHPELDITIKPEDSDSSLSALHRATINGDVKTVKLLISYPKITTNLEEEWVLDLLKITCAVSHIECLKLLLSLKEPNMPDKSRMLSTALSTAKACKQIACVQLLENHIKQNNINMEAIEIQQPDNNNHLQPVESINHQPDVTSQTKDILSDKTQSKNPSIQSDNNNFFKHSLGKDDNQSQTMVCCHLTMARH